MAVTLTSYPQTVQPIGNGFEFGLTLDASGSGTDVYSIGYKLYDASDVLITELEQIQYTGSEEMVDFKEDIRSQIYTTIQQPTDSPVLELDTNFQKQFYLIYGQIEFDTDTCITDTSNVSADSKSIDNYFAINSAFEWYEDYSPLASGDLTVLSDRPQGVFLTLMQNYSPVAMDQRAYLTIYREQGAGNILVSRTSFDSQGNALTANIDTVAASGAHIYDCSPINDTFADENTAYYRVDIRESIGEPIAVYDFVVEDCGDAPIRELHWIEPKGTQSSLVFPDVVIGGNQTARSTYEIKQPSGLTTTQKGLNYGASRTDVRGEKRLTMTRTMRKMDGLEKWLDGLFASKEHYVKYPIGGGSYTMAKFVLDDGSYETYNDDELLIQIVGRIHLNINNL